MTITEIAAVGTFVLFVGTIIGGLIIANTNIKNRVSRLEEEADDNEAFRGFMYQWTGWLLVQLPRISRGEDIDLNQAPRPPRKRE